MSGESKTKERKVSRQFLWAEKKQQEGKCRTCGKLKGKSPYTGHCIQCAVKDRLRKRKKLGWGEWRPGGTGRKPLTVKVES